MSIQMSDPVWEDVKAAYGDQFKLMERVQMEGWKARFFRTPEMVAKMNHVNPDIYWRNYFVALNTIFHESLPKDPKLAI